MKIFVDGKLYDSKTTPITIAVDDEKDFEVTAKAIASLKGRMNPIGFYEPIMILFLPDDYPEQDITREWKAAYRAASNALRGT